MKYLCILLAVLIPMQVLGHVPERNTIPIPLSHDRLIQKGEVEVLSLSVFATGKLVYNGERSTWRIALNKANETILFIVEARIPYELIMARRVVAAEHFAHVRQYDMEDGTFLTVFTIASDICTAATFRNGTCVFQEYFVSLLQGIVDINLFESMYLEEVSYAEVASD